MGDKAKKHKKGDTKRKAEARRARPEAKASASGFHVPPELRETGARLFAIATSPAGRELLAAGIAVAATAAQAALRGKTGPAAAAKSATPAADAEPGEAGTTRAPDAQAIAATIGTVAESLFAQMFRPKTP